MTRHRTAEQVDLAVAAVAARQWGVASRRQLAAAGMSRQQVDAGVRRGRLIRLHRGVYAVGHARLRREGRWLAAVLAAPRPAALGGRDAAALHGLRSSDHERVEVVTAGRSRRPQPGLRIRHTRVLGEEDVTAVLGVPVTTVARTLVDLAHAVPRTQLWRVLNEAELQRVFDLGAIESALRRTAGRPGPGHAALRAALDELARRGAQLTRSALEERLEALVQGNGLPPPRLNAHVCGREVDAWWPREAVAVEADGGAAHRTRTAFQRDREKGNALALAGIVLLRFTHRDVVARPAAVAAQIRAALEAGERTRSARSGPFRPLGRQS